MTAITYPLAEGVYGLPLTVWLNEPWCHFCGEEREGYESSPVVFLGLTEAKTHQRARMLCLRCRHPFTTMAEDTGKPVPDEGEAHYWTSWFPIHRNATESLP